MPDRWRRCRIVGGDVVIHLDVRREERMSLFADVRGDVGHRLASPFVVSGIRHRQAAGGTGVVIARQEYPGQSDLSYPASGIRHRQAAGGTGVVIAGQGAGLSGAIRSGQEIL